MNPAMNPLAPVTSTVRDAVSVSISRGFQSSGVCIEYYLVSAHCSSPSKSVWRGGAHRATIVSQRQRVWRIDEDHVHPVVEFRRVVAEQTEARMDGQRGFDVVVLRIEVAVRPGIAGQDAAVEIEKIVAVA